MTDLPDLLARALPDLEDVAPGADVARGHRALQRRHRTAAIAGGGTLAALVAAAAVVVVAHDGNRVTDTARPAAPPSPQASRTVPPELDPTPGFSVSSVPPGWKILGGSPYHLLLVRTGDPDRSLDRFAGKILVMLRPTYLDAPTGTPQPVAGREGWYRIVPTGQVPAEDDLPVGTADLEFQDGTGRWILVQAPPSLGWDAGQLAQWSAGITVLPNALVED
jgi:hypothetical protein